MRIPDARDEFFNIFFHRECLFFTYKNISRSFSDLIRSILLSISPSLPLCFYFRGFILSPFLSLVRSTIILMKIWWDIISPTDCPHYRTMPAGYAGISGIARSTFDLNSGRFLRGPFYPRRGDFSIPRGCVHSSFVSQSMVRDDPHLRARN